MPDQKHRGYEPKANKSETYRRLWAVLEMHRAHDHALDRSSLHRREELCEALTMEVEQAVSERIVQACREGW